MVYCLSEASGYVMKAVNLPSDERKSISGVKNRLNEVDDTDVNRLLEAIVRFRNKVYQHTINMWTKQSWTKIEGHFSPQWASCDNTACDLLSKQYTV